MRVYVRMQACVCACMFVLSLLCETEPDCISYSKMTHKSNIWCNLGNDQGLVSRLKMNGGKEFIIYIMFVSLDDKRPFCNLDFEGHRT